MTAPGLESEQAGRAQADAIALNVNGTGFTMAGLAEVFVRSGFFKDVKQQSQAIVKMLYGQELGLKPIQSMLSIYMVEGRPEVAAGTLGAIIRKSGTYDYSVKEHDATKCAIQFFRVYGKDKDGRPVREECGLSTFTIQDAERAQLAGKFNYKNYPKNMMFARAMSNGVKWYCLDAVGSVPVYTEGEIVEERESLGIPPEPETPPTNPFMPSQRVQEAAVVVLAGEPGVGGPEKPATAPAGEQAAQDVLPGLVDGHSGRVERLADPAVAGSGTLTSEALVSNDVPPGTPDDGNGGSQSFSIGGTTLTTKGCTKSQMVRLFALGPQVNRKIERGIDKKILFQMFGVLTKNDLTEAQADKYIAQLEKALDEAGGPSA